MDTLAELCSLSQMHEENDVTINNTSDLYNILELEDNHEFLLLKETQSTSSYCETERNSYSEDCGFPGFSTSENKGFFKYGGFLLKESENVSKYKYFSHFIRGANGNIPEITDREEQDSIDGVHFYSYEREDDMLSSRHTDSISSEQHNDDEYFDLEDENMSILSFSNMEYVTNINNMEGIRRTEDVSNMAVNTIECDEGFYVSGIQNICDSDSDLLNDYFVSYNLEKDCNESSNSIGHMVNNDSDILDTFNFSADEEVTSMNENTYEYFDNGIQNSGIETELRRDNIFVFKMCDDSVNDKRIFLCNFGDKSNYIEKTKHVNIGETENYIWNELNAEMLNSYPYSGGSEYNSDMNLNHEFKETVELYDNNLYFQSMQTLNEENSSNSYSRWELSQKQTKETPLIVKIQETKLQQNENNLALSRGNGYNCLGVELDTNKLELEMNEDCNSNKNVKENCEYVKEGTMHRQVNIQKTMFVAENMSKTHLENENIAHENIKPVEYSLKKSSCENWMDSVKYIKPCSVRLDVLQGECKLKVRCLIHNKYECKCINRNKNRVKCGSLCSEQNKLFKNIEKNYGWRRKKRKTLQEKQKKFKMKSLYRANGKLSDNNSAETVVCTDGTSIVAQEIYNSNSSGTLTHNLCRGNLYEMNKLRECQLPCKYNKLDDVNTGVDNNFVRSVSLHEEENVCKMSGVTFSADCEDFHFVKNLRLERNNSNEIRSKESGNNIQNFDVSVSGVSDICTSKNKHILSTNARSENMYDEHLDRYNNEQNINIDYAKTSNLGSVCESSKNVSANVEEEGIEIVHVQQRKQSPRFKEEATEFEDVLIINESPVSSKVHPIIKTEKLLDISENNESDLDQRNKAGIFDLSKSLDSDFEEYTESLDGLSENSDEEVDEVKDGIIVHKPLKDFARSIVVPLSKEVFNKPREAIHPDHEPKPVLICSTPGIGYVHVIEHDKEKIIIEDPVDPKLRHQFSSNGHASNWLDRFLQQKMTFEYGVKLSWPFLHHTLSSRAYHFNPKILKNKKLIVTESGVQKLPNYDSKQLKRFHYRRKLENYSAKLSYLVTSEYDISALPLSVLLKKATKVIQQEKETALKLQYEQQMLSRICSKLKMKLTATIKGVESRNITKALRLLNSVDCNNVLENSHFSPKKHVRRKANTFTEDIQKGKANKTSQTNEFSCGADKLREGQRFLHVSSQTAVNNPEEKNISENILQVRNHSLALPSIVSVGGEETCSTYNSVSTKNNTMLPARLNKCVSYKELADNSETEVQNAKEIHGENIEYSTCVRESTSKNEDRTLIKGCFSKDRLVHAHHCGINVNKKLDNHNGVNTHLLRISQGLSADHIRRNLYVANLKKIKAWQANRKHTSSSVSQSLSANITRCNLYEDNLKISEASQVNKLQTGSPALQKLSVDHIRRNLYKANLQKIKAWQDNRLQTDSLNTVSSAKHAE